uniref:Uncharacterized protein n=1 Tax=Ackermannviridae sp. TaxID=2831612 RepID=A0A8S5VKF4_9CAUD|nr:MAG TPA: hypothetical protein [Ackermannviridae sp.]
MSGAANNPYLEAGRDDLLRIMIAPNAGAHNAIYRGKYLGTSVTAAQYAAIAAGTFDDLYIGDYWTIGGVNYRIAAFDYWLNCGDTACTDHHVVIVPDSCLLNAPMNTTNTTAGGYMGSQLNISGIEQAKGIIKNAFGASHLMGRRIYLTTKVTNGIASDGAWFSDSVTIMCEQMVYGSGIFSPVSDGRTIPANFRIEKFQLPLFQHDPSKICNRTTWWLRDVITDFYFATVTNDGGVYYTSASNSRGVRPYFCIK